MWLPLKNSSNRWSRSQRCCSSCRYRWQCWQQRCQWRWPWRSRWKWKDYSSLNNNGLQTGSWPLRPPEKTRQIEALNVSSSESYFFMQAAELYFRFRSCDKRKTNKTKDLDVRCVYLLNFIYLSIIYNNQNPRLSWWLQIIGFHSAVLLLYNY